MLSRSRACPRNFSWLGRLDGGAEALCQLGESPCFQSLGVIGWGVTGPAQWENTNEMLTVGGAKHLVEWARRYLNPKEINLEWLAAIVEPRSTVVL